MNLGRIRQAAPLWTIAGAALLCCLLASSLAWAATLTLRPGWNLVTAPHGAAMPALPADLDIFGLGTRAYSPESAQAMTPGRGYWVFAPDAVSMPVPDTASAPDTVSLDLAPGWNLAGNPFSQGIAAQGHAWVLDGGKTVPFLDSDCVSPAFYAFDSQENDYEALPGEQTIEPLQGFLVRAARACTLVMSNPARAAGGGSSEPAARRPWVRPMPPGNTAIDPATGFEAAAGELVLAAPAGMTLEQFEAKVRAAGGTVAGGIPEARLLQAVLPPGASAADFAARLGLDPAPSTRSAAANLIFSASTPNDPVFSDGDPNNDYQFSSMNAAAALDLAAVSPLPRAPVIAILDTGLDAGHEEFSGRVLPGYNFIASNEDTADDNGHGTRAAGLAAAAAGNGTGGAGLCPQCRILPVKTLDADGRATAFAVLAAMYYAADNGASVISISISGPSDHGLLEQKFSEAAAYARARGAVVVAAAGNNGADASDYLPGAAANVFTVGAVNNRDERAPFSNHGHAVFVSAPGDMLYTADRGNGYAWFSGTSAAAPLAAGAAGLLMALHPDWTPAHTEFALTATARPVSTDYALGAGVIDLGAALAATPSGGASTGGGSGMGGTGTGGGSGMGAAGVCMVTHNGDSGINSLRWCISYANTNGGADTIQFGITDARIDLLTALPPLTDPAGVTIDGSGRKIVISGHFLSPSDGIRIQSANNTIKDISIIRFRSDAGAPFGASGIRITGIASTDNQIIGCRIGTDYLDKTGYDNANGVIIENQAARNIITSETGAKSVISGNYHAAAGHGIYINGAKNTTIVKSIIGAKSDGISLLENYGSGIYIEGDGSDDTVIGGDTGVSMGNLISGNNGYGIFISDGDNTKIYGNYIGVDNSGNTILANKKDGVRIINSAKSTLVGNHNNGFRNVLSGNGGSGVHVEGAASTVNIILNNYIGVGADGATPAGNKNAGVYLKSVPYTYVGVDHLDNGSGNIIANSSTYGVILNGADAQNNLIQYNKIGVDKNGNAAGNTAGGILIIGSASNNRIGAKDHNLDGANDIAHNKRNGIEARDSGSVRNKFFKNSFYQNQGLAVDLNNDGVTPNSSTPPGPNDYTDFPVITQITSAGGNCYNISGTKAPNTYAHIYYASKPSAAAQPDPSGNGEGYEYHGMSSSAVAAATFTYSGICFSECMAISTLGHDTNGNTSEFGPWYDLCIAPVISDVQFTPDTVIANGMQKTRVTATVTYANGMSYISAVTVNLTDAGGPVALPLYDDGAHADGAAGDGVYGSDRFSVPESVAAGDKNIPVTASDLLGKSGSAAGTLTVQTIALPQPCGEDWTMFSCNAANSGQSAQTFKWPLTLKWSKTTDFSSNIYTSPAIFETHIYVGENSGRAYAVNKADGSLAWQYDTGGDSFRDNAPAVWNNSVFFAAESGKMYSLNRLSGTLNWIFDTGGRIRGSSPVIANDTLYFGSETGTFYALNPSTKAVKWSYSPGFGSTYSFGDSPAAVVNGVVYATSNNCTVYALDAFTGELYWSRELTTATCQIAGSGVTVSGDYVCTSTWDDDRAYCLNKYTGAIVWSAYNPNAFVDSNGALYNGMYILGTGDGTLAAYDIQTGALRWQTSLDNSLAFSSPVVFNDYVYVTDGAWSVNRGVLYALDPNDNGREVWRYDAGANIVSSPAVSGNLLVFGTSNDASSALLAFEPGTSYKCPGWTVTTSAADGDGSLYDCVMAANESAGTQTISFSISNAVIKPVNPIPFEDYGGPVIIDASGRNIIVDGSDCALCSGFEIAADNSSLKGLAVVQYRRDGRHAIDIQADGVTIDSCRVGTNFIDSTAIGNSSGIYVAGANNKIINSVIAGNSKTGVTIDGTDTTGTLVQNNKIGVKSTGMAALKNGTGGILITGGAHANTIGGSASASQGNIISGNTPGYAVRITGPGADNNAVQGNIIGLGLIGSPALPNNGGVQIFSGARGTVVGGTQDYGNVISGNYGTAVNLSTAPDTVIRGNVIGLSRDGLQTRSNTEYGIAIYEGYNAVVGGAATERNIISANEKSGIYAISTSGMSIRNNLIGVKQDMTPAGNLQTGITFTATVTATTIGGAAGDANVIANNGGAGVEVTGSPAGLTIRANSIYENGGKGIVTGHDYSLSIDTVIKNGSAYDATGASTCGACTVEIFQADDTGAGVSADPAGSGEGYDLLATVTTDAAGAWSATGLTPSANANYISATITDSGGNTTEFAANKKLPRTECPGFVVSSNADAGYATLRQCMAEANADNAPSDITFHTSMSGKTITLASGLPTLTDNATTIRNTSGGQVTVSGGGNPWYCFSILSSNNEIRGLTIVKCGDMTAGHGIGISGSTATNNLIAGNYIGTNSSGAAGLGNRTGILITSSAYANTIGGTTAADRNVVSGNTVGVNLHTTTSNNMVIGNYIGTNPLGTGKVANFVGVVISSGSNLNTVGGTDSSRRNLVSGNSIGILIQGAGSDANKIYGNYIGSDKNGDKVSNLQNGTGVKIETSAKNNAVGGAFTGQPNRIVFNDSHGVLIKDSGTTGNTVSRNVTFDNAGKGIALESGGNASRAAPSIVTITALGAGAYDISGTTAPACAGCTVELFRVDDTASSVGQDATLAGEAYAFVATATTTAAGAWSFTNLTITGGRYVTATVTDTNGNTSEFALNKRLNASPVISSLTSSSVDVSFYEAVTLSATASDPDGDPLTYEWSGGGHSPFSATTSASTNWTAPRDAYWATLTLTVRDPYGGMDTESVPVRVGIKDISNIKVFPHTSEIKRNSSRTFEIQAHFTTGAIFDISAESAKVKNGLGTINTNGFFQAGSTTGNEEVTFTVGRFMGTISVKIIP